MSSATTVIRFVMIWSCSSYLSNLRGRQEVQVVSSVRSLRSLLHRHLLIFCKSWAIIPCHWPVTQLIFACILRVLSNSLIPLIGQIVDICLYLQVLSNYPVPLIGQIIDNCLYFTGLEQLSHPLDWSDHWYMLVLFKYWAIILCHWSVGSLTFACILQVSRNYLMPLISQIIDICLYFTSVEQLSNAIDRSDHLHLLVFCKYLIPLIGQIIDICLYFASLEQWSDAIDRSDYRYLLVFYKTGATIRCHW